MSAVKRVRKLLSLIEKRAMKNVKLVNGPGKDKEKLGRVAEGAAKAREEKIYVKGTGQAMQQALRVGEWFRNKEEEWEVEVEVRTGSVVVVDDIVEVDTGMDEDGDMKGLDSADGKDSNTDGQGSTSSQEKKDDMNIDSNSHPQEARHHNTPQPPANDQTLTSPPAATKPPNEPGPKLAHRRIRKKNKRPMYDQDETPEARTRWIKMVEVIIGLK
ncbi:hypothetical protein UCRPC4_g02339 [Phaeomoniella chlamydospora]|uniref:Uncharacterized protein n=1 Tax=Phaeomoniella chlamydospora TaxID=158046 RepID=A0A0G2ERD3_PHACM|nr:hypothetical protein UCRPC4_g02339 [Phaeomoniella chlamydospora]